MITSISAAALRDFFSVDVSQLSSAQVENFLEHLREKAEEAEKNQQLQKKELAEQTQRNADQRRDRLQQSLMQSLNEIDSLERKKELDSIEDRKILRKQELDQAENKAILDARLDRKQADSNAQMQSAANQIASDPFAIGQQMQSYSQSQSQSISANHPLSSENSAKSLNGSLPQPLHLQSISSEIFRVPGSIAENPFAQNTTSQNTNLSFDSTQISQNVVLGNISNSVPNAAANTTATNAANASAQHSATESALGSKVMNLESADTTNQNNADLGRHIQMLASFSEHSGRLASVLMRPGQRTESKSGSNFSTDSLDRGSPYKLTGKSTKNSAGNSFSSHATASTDSASFFHLDWQSAEEIASANSTNTGSNSKIPLYDLELENGDLSKNSFEEDLEFLTKLEAALAKEQSQPQSAQQEQSEDPYVAHQQSQMYESTKANSDSEHFSNSAEAQHSALSSWDRARLIQRVANACQSATNQNGTIRMKLHPEELGSVSVKVEIQGNSIRIELESETEQARQTLLENADQLKKQLLSQGMRVEAFSVSVAR